MTHFASKETVAPHAGPGHMGYTVTEYAEPGCHDDQEGFVVLSGEGYARIGSEEAAIRKGTTFIAPAGTPHAIRSASADVPVEVFWFHAAI